MLMNRRKLITGLIALVAAPAIVRVESLMPIKVLPLIPYRINLYVDPVNGRDLVGYGMSPATAVRTIQEALNEAFAITEAFALPPENAITIHLTPGLYDGPVYSKLSRPLEIVGAGIEETTIAIKVD